MSQPVSKELELPSLAASDDRRPSRNCQKFEDISSPSSVGASVQARDNESAKSLLLADPFRFVAANWRCLCLTTKRLPQTTADDILNQIVASSEAGLRGWCSHFCLSDRVYGFTLLEAHEDFDRKFRGDTIHPSVLEIFDQIGLSDALLQLQHSKIYGPTLRAANTSFNPFNFRRLKTKFPFVMLVPQSKFLDFLSREAGKYEEFDLRFSSKVESLIDENGTICGVRYTGRDGAHEVNAPLVIGADGRFSTVRKRAGLIPIKTSPSMDILWFELPHLPEDAASDRVLGGFGMGRVLAVFDRFDHWQVGYVFPKGTYQQVRAEGLESLRSSIAAVEPRFTKHVESLTDWRQFSLLSVESSFCPKWYLPGLLLIGDAAHVMSPIGGNLADCHVAA